MKQTSITMPLLLVALCIVVLAIGYVSRSLIIDLSNTPLFVIISNMTSNPSEKQQLNTPTQATVTAQVEKLEKNAKELSKINTILQSTPTITQLKKIKIPELPKINDDMMHNQALTLIKEMDDLLGKLPPLPNSSVTNKNKVQNPNRQPA